MRKFVLSTVLLLFSFSLLAQFPMSKLIAKKASASVTYATWNPSDKDADVTLSGGNLIASGTNVGGVRATISKTSGKWTWEVTLTSTSGVFDVFLGIATSTYNLNTNLGAAVTGWSLVQDDGAYFNNGFVDILSAYTTTAGDIITIALDMDAGTLTFYKNGTLLGGGALFTGITGTIFPALSIQFDTVTLTTNFGPTLTYPVAGYNEGVY